MLGYKAGRGKAGRGKVRRGKVRMYFLYYPTSMDWVRLSFFGGSDMLKRSEVLIKRSAYLADRRVFPNGIDNEKIDFSRSAVEEYEYEEFVILRSADDILAVFDVDGWQVTRLPPEKWPDYVLHEALLVEAE